MPTRSAPAGYHTITPRIFTDDVAGLVAFLEDVFGGVNEARPGAPAEVRIGDSLVMVSGTDVREALPGFLYVYVDAADATHARAVAAGATSLEDPRDVPYGDRRAMVRDAWGNTWQIATRL